MAPYTTRLAVLLLALCCAHGALARQPPGLTCYVSYTAFQVIATCTDQGGDCPGIIEASKRGLKIPEKSNSLIAVTIPNFGMNASDPGVCTRYFVRDTEVELEMWIYGFMPKSYCEGLIKNTLPVPKGEGVRHFICCSTNKCNTPDKILDPVRTIVQTPRRF